MKKPQAPNALQRSKWEKVPPWVSIFIAILALGFTLFGAREQRRANRLSVTPYLSLYSDLSSDSDDEVGLYVQNIGLGPAIILDRSIHFDGHIYHEDSGESFASFSGINEPWKLDLILPGASIAPGRRYMVLGFDRKDMTPERKRLLYDVIFPKLRYEIKFASFYGESWTIVGGMETSADGSKSMHLQRTP